jgi:hypothetical protein
MTRAPLLTLEDVLEQEARAWRESPPSEYDSAITSLIKGHASDAKIPRRAQVLLAIASTTLRRSNELLTESRAVCAEQLLGLACASDVADERSRARALFLLAWLRLLSTVAGGPETVRTSAPLPAGAGIPHGADIDWISDPGVRAQAKALAELHLREVERWKAKQGAFHHLNNLAGLLRILRGHADDAAAWEEVRTAAALTVELTLHGPDRLNLLKTLSPD